MTVIYFNNKNYVMTTGKKKPKARKIGIRSPRRDSELYITKRLLDLTKTEIKSDIAALRMEMKAGFAKVDTKFQGMSAEITGVKAELAGVKADISEVKHAINKVIVLVEEQNERNKVVLDSYALVYDKLTNHDLRLRDVEKKAFGIEQE